MTFTCSLDKFSKIITGLLFLLALSLFLLAKTELMIPLNEKMHVGILSGILLLIVLFFSFGFAPRSYSIENKNIIIKRLLGDKIIKAEEIIKISIPQEKEMAWPIRKFGNGGLFGYTGLYYTKHIGTMTWSCSRRSNFILIQRKNKKPFVISPDEQGLFLKYFNS